MGGKCNQPGTGKNQVGDLTKRPDFRLGTGWARLIPEEMHRNGIRRLGIEAAHTEAVARLPWHHRDPFDRLLIAQAQTENLTLLSRDSHIPRYAVPWTW